MPDEYGNNNRGTRYAVAMAFLFLMPGALLAVLHRFQLMVLPRSVIELCFPIAILPVEERLLVALYDQSVPVDHAKMNPEIFETLDIFGQQTFVVALLCFLLILVIYFLKARADALYAQPTVALIPVLLIVVLASAIARLFFLYLLVASTDSLQSNLPTRIVSHYVMNVFAPEGLVIFTCLIAICLAQVTLFTYRLMSRAFA